MIATVDVARLRYRSLPDWLCGMTPQDVLVELRGDQPLLWDLAPAPFPVTWTELAEARAGVRSAKHRLVVAEPRTDRSTWPARPPPGWPTPGRACWSRRCATSACPGWASGPSC